MTARTLSEPNACWVSPIDQTRIAESAAAYMDAKRSMSARLVPDIRSSSSQPSPSRASDSSSQPVVWSAMKRSSRPPAAARAFRMPAMKAMSPPVLTWKNSSVIFVPNTALSAFEGTQ